MQLPVIITCAMAIADLHLMDSYLTFGAYKTAAACFETIHNI